jgi:sporulation protein YlmC with PRC-barrel domain
VGAKRRPASTLAVPLEQHRDIEHRCDEDQRSESRYRRERCRNHCRGLEERAGEAPRQGGAAELNVPAIVFRHSAETIPEQTIIGPPLTTLPPGVTTVANYYKQSVYDPSDVKIGEISDVLLNKEGKVDAFIIGVGGFLGISEKDVAVPFDAVHAMQKDGKWYLTMNANKDALKNARGYKFDKAKSTWEPV